MATACALIFSHDDKGHFNYHDLPQQQKDQLYKDFDQQFRSVDRNLTTNKPFEIIITPEEASALQISSKQENIQKFGSRYGDISKQSVVQKIINVNPNAQSDLVLGLGNPELNEGMAAVLPKALERIGNFRTYIPGLYNSANDGARSWASALKQGGPGKADGHVYEVLCTAKLMDTPITSATGVKFQIKDTYHLAFGAKDQAAHGGGGPIHGRDEQGPFTFQQGYRKTIEGDIKLGIPAGPGGLLTKEVAIDFKHTNGTVCHIDDNQLDHVKIALETGVIDSFYYIGNEKFPSPTMDKIKEINEELRQLPLFSDKEDPIQVFENISWKS